MSNDNTKLKAPARPYTEGPRGPQFRTEEQDDAQLLHTKEAKDEGSTTTSEAQA